MKKILLSGLAAASLFAGVFSDIVNFSDNNTTYAIGAGAVWMNVNKSSEMHYSINTDLRLLKYLPNKNIFRIDLEKDVYGDTPNLGVLTFNLEKYFDIAYSPWQRYLFAGAGYEYLNHYKNGVVIDFGGGVRYKGWSKRWLPFYEVRFMRKFSGADNYYSHDLGIIFKFGHLALVDNDKDDDGVPNAQDRCPNTPLGVKVDKYGCPDTDADGVPDYLDKCADTPKGVKVDASGCPYDTDADGVPDYKDKCANTPAGVKIDKNGCAIDTDKDGVPDYKDQCANTPKGAEVNANGCVLDSDGDGVIDSKDKCPNTLQGMTVDKNGCALKYNFDITFPHAEAILTPMAQVKVSQFATFLQEHPNVKAKIIGYTDNVGPVAYNIGLSKKRAEAVYEALINLGIKADRLSYIGYGPLDPIASNKTEEGRARNRRVIAQIIYPKAKK